MKRSITAAAALLAGIAIAAPMLAWSATEGDPRMAQAAPAQPGMGGMGERGGAMGHPDSMRERMMHRMAQLPPQQRCEERLARRAARVAYVATKLNLTPEQRPLWEKLRGQMQAAADRQHQLCASLKPAGDGSQPTILDRINRREQFLSARLQALKDTRPALELLYQSLTPEQKAIIDHPFRRG